MAETTTQRTVRLLTMTNAQLIMHAQDLTLQRDELLVALKTARGWLSGWGSAEPYLATINAAIAKAEGIDGWIPWAGGVCPVSTEQRVRFRLRNGAEDESRAGTLDWAHGFNGEPTHCDDLGAYRVLEAK